jgi:hypothetical protein
MRNGRLIAYVLASLIVISLAGCNSRPNVSGVWKGSIESTDKRGHKWNAPAELTLNQNGDALTGTLIFSNPQGDRIQVPISSGVASKDAVTFSGQNQYPMASIEITFHGKLNGTTLAGTAEMTSRSLILGPATERASLTLNRQ